MSPWPEKSLSQRDRVGQRHIMGAFQRWLPGWDEGIGAGRWPWGPTLANYAASGFLAGISIESSTSQMASSDGCATPKEIIRASLHLACHHVTRALPPASSSQPPHCGFIQAFVISHQECRKSCGLASQSPVSDPFQSTLLPG